MKTRLPTVICSTLPVIALCVACGSGGNGGNSTGGTNGGTPTTTSFAVIVNWPAYNANAPAGDPASSQSARLILTGANPDGSDAKITDNRTQQTAYTETETFLNIKQTPTQLDIIFFAGTNCQPPILGTGHWPVNPGPSHNPPVVGPVVIASLAIAPNQIVGVAGAPSPLLYTAYDSAGNIAAVPANAIVNWAVVSGATNLQISGGLAKGLSVGTAQVTVSINQITSPVQTVQIVPQQATITGYVRDTSPVHNPVRGATVTVPGTSRTSITNAAGVFVLTNVPLTATSIRVAAPFGNAYYNYAIYNGKEYDLMNCVLPLPVLVLGYNAPLSDIDMYLGGNNPPPPPPVGGCPS